MGNNKEFIPNSTQIPNILLDHLLPRVSLADRMCLLYICRRTFGFHKDEDRISFSQFIDGIKSRDGKVLDRGTGLSRPAIAEALRYLVESGAVFVQKSRRGNTYKINLDMDVEQVVKQLNQLRYLTKSSKAALPKQVKLFNLQNTRKKRENYY